MTSSLAQPVRPRSGKADAVVCTAKPAHSRGVVTIGRMQGLDTAASLLGGQQALGNAIGIEARSLRAKLSAERGITDGDLRLTITALECQAKRMLAHVEKLRREILPESTSLSAPEPDQLDIERAIEAVR